MAPKIDMLGKQFGDLIVIKEVRGSNFELLWECLCSCGNISKVCGGSLRSGRTKSCGCKEGNKPKHGKSKTRTYNIWMNIKQRCFNKNRIDFKYYGGRGITICDRWLKFENFLKDMGEAPENLTIERKNNNGNYEPDNCIWADMKTQVHNRSI